MAMSYVMKVSRNGQVSIPAEARARWGTDRVVVVDLGDRVVMRPVSAGGVDDLVGSITGLALFLLFLPLISLVIRKLRGG
jgi:AbrB family looped-hinge helix DNA binding protein